MSIIPSIFGGRRSSVFDPFTLDVWDPFKDISASFPEMSKEASAIVNARVDWKETPEAHVFKADLPGLKKEEVKVELEEGRVLQISGERSRESEEKNDKWHRVERSSGKFVRRFQLPENAKVDEVKAAMENGVLTVTVPKEQVKKPEVKAIEISEDTLLPQKRTVTRQEKRRLTQTLVSPSQFHLSPIKSSRIQPSDLHHPPTELLFAPTESTP